MIEARSKVQVAFLIVFLLGFAAGALSLTAYNRRIRAPHRFARTGKFDRERYVKQMTEAVGVRSEQMGPLNAILDDTREEFLALRRGLDPEFDEIRQRARIRIRGILDAEQQTRFDTFLRKWDEERQAEEQAGSGLKAQERTP